MSKHYVTTSSSFINEIITPLNKHGVSHLSDRIVYPGMSPDPVLHDYEDLLKHVSPSDFLKPLGLTKKEIECAYHLKCGFQIKQIANQMYISPRTVEKHIAALKKKTKTKSMQALIILLNKLFI